MNKQYLFVFEGLSLKFQKIEEDEYATTITFNSNQTDEVLHWILSQGHNAKPLEPEWLVDQWKFHIKQMSKLI